MVRVKRRYILLNVKYQKGKPTQESLSRKLKDKVGEIYGDFGIACLNRGYQVKKHDASSGDFIICVRKGVQEMLMSVFPTISHIDQEPCCLNLVHLSGTMRGCLKVLKKEDLMSLRASIAKLTRDKGIQDSKKVHT